jgi:CRISPR-associated protein Cas1
MIKRTLYFGNPAYLSKKDDQLVIKLPEVERNDALPAHIRNESKAQVPIEDIGVVVLDHQQITVSHAVLSALLEQNVALVVCGETHLPTGLMLNLAGHTLQSARFRAQIEASVPLKKQLWQQTVSAKIFNQAFLLRKQGHEIGNMLAWADAVRSGDTGNLEARASAYYWKKLMHTVPSFTRDREGIPPNGMLNYVYAILRAIIARSLVGAGLLPTLGIFHRNQYNHYCLADDIMEPYRPLADELVMEWMQQGKDLETLTTEAKKHLLGIGVRDIYLDKQKSPLMVGTQRTAASLAKCFEGDARKLLYPEVYLPWKPTD